MAFDGGSRNGCGINSFNTGRGLNDGNYSDATIIL